MLRTPQERLLTACCALACCFTAFSFRLVHIQVTMHDTYAEQAAEAHGTKKIIHARRGSILDVRGAPLATNEPVKTVVVDGSLIADREALARLLAPSLEMTEKAVLEKLSRERWSDKEKKNVPVRYTVLKRDVAETVAMEIQAKLAARSLDPQLAKAEKKNARAITFEQESIRVYPNGEMACHVIGFTNHDSLGVEGVERSMNDVLRARDGYRYSERDREGREMVQFRGQERPPQNGSDVRLTIDSGLQMIVEAELNTAVKQLKPEMATAIMMRPQTGEVLAMASWPHFNLNEQEGVPEAYRKNHAIMDQVEPGSTFKIVPASAALSLHLVDIDTMIFCENGHFTYHGNTLHDHKPLGEITVADVLVHSSNVGAAKLGIQLGDQRLFEFVRRYGFGERSGINLPGEIPGRVIPPSQWSQISITHLPMGHEVGVTPIQICTAMSVIANGGRLLTPQIVHEVIEQPGGAVTSFPPVEVRRVIQEKVADQVRNALAQVVSKRGTAQRAHVPGFLVGGKTGTAQKPNGNKGYMKGKYIVSFVGFMPAQKPEFVCLVLIDDAKVSASENYGGQVAAPIFARIAEKAARHLNLTPTEPILPGEVAGAGEAVRD